MGEGGACEGYAREPRDGALQSLQSRMLVYALVFLVLLMHVYPGLELSNVRSSLD